MIGGVHYSKQLVKSLEKNLRSAFRQSHLELTKKPHNPGTNFRISLVTGDKTVIGHGAPEHVLRIMLSDGTSTPFYFGFVTVFQCGPGVDILESSSLTIFHGVVTGETVPLFRAEWDRISASDGSKHAQPHWHFVQRPEQISGIGQSASGEFDPEMTELFSELVDCRGIHFALTSLWDKQRKESRPKQLFESDDFQKWFEYLTVYVAGQIEYIVSKMPPGSAEEFALK